MLRHRRHPHQEKDLRKLRIARAAGSWVLDSIIGHYASCQALALKWMNTHDFGTSDAIGIQGGRSHLWLPVVSAVPEKGGVHYISHSIPISYVYLTVEPMTPESLFASLPPALRFASMTLSIGRRSTNAIPGGSCGLLGQSY